MVDQKYRLEECLGEGAVGVVYRAVHVGLEKSFAIKLLKTAGPPAPAALERFRREAVALGRLRHPHIVEVTDFGIDGAEGGRPYIVTEFLRGRPLSDVCRDRGQLPLAQALPLLEQIAAAVDAAHEAGILHRDLKPGNVFVCSENLDSPSVKVLDFGLAKLLGGPDRSSDVTVPFGEEGGPGLTASGSLLGTPLYLAPELIRLGLASRASDVYAFGVLAYEILGGRPPFLGSLDEVLGGHLKAAPPPLPLPPEIWRPLRAALQKDPTLRPASAGEVVRRLRKGMAEAEAPGPPVASAPAMAAPQMRAQASGSRGTFLFAAMLLLAVAGVGTLGFLLGRRPGPLSGTGDAVESREEKARPPFQTRRPALPLTRPARQPAEPETSDMPLSPGVTLGFGDIERACGDLSTLPTYLCLLNRGSDPVAGGARLVVDDTLATFTTRPSFGNSVSISIEGKERYRLEFAPPKGKGLVPGLYTGAMRWPFNEGPHPGIDVGVGSSGCNTEEGQFHILQFELTGGDKVRRFVADFETSCNQAVGRISIGQPGDKPPLPVAWQPAETPSSGAPTSPGVTLKFDDIGRACGDLSLPNFLCLVNRGSEVAAGGARLVLGEDLASFTGQTSHGNSVSISVQGKERYRLEFGPPKGKPLIPGLYTGATRWPFNDGPYPGIDVTVGSSGCNTEDGQFRVLQIELAGNRLQRFMADFETTCNGAIGRVAMGQAGQAGQPGNKIEIRRRGAPQP